MKTMLAGQLFTTSGRCAKLAGRSCSVGQRAGMTLVEVLVAMVILLVGVWAVARGFPTLMRAVASEQKRTQAARLAENRVEVLKQSADSLPFAIRGPAANAADIDPDSVPRDPDSTTNPLNSRDDVTEVVEERAKVPAPDVGSNYSLLALSQGLLQEDPTTIQIWKVTRLQRLAYPPSGGSAPAGFFYFDSSGMLTLPPGHDGVRVDYAWVDNGGQVHWVQGERILASATSITVRPVGSGVFAQALPSTAAVEALDAFAVLPVGTTTPQPGEVAIAPFGLGLIFNGADAGASVVIDYQMRARANGKRELYMMEDHVVGQDLCVPDPADSSFYYASVQLAWPGLEPHLTTVFPGITGVYSVVGVDLVSGAGYWEGNGIEPVDVNAATTGLLRLHVPAQAVGHRFRFFYTTDDQASIQVYKPPATFFDSTTAASYPNPTLLRHRTYTVEVQGSGRCLLHFSPSNIGFTVAVDYVYDDGGTPRLVAGEMHTLAPSSDGTEALCALFHPNVLEIRAVRGVSLRVRAWWRRPSGKLTHFDLDTILAPLGAV